MKHFVALKREYKEEEHTKKETKLRKHRKLVS